MSASSPHQTDKGHFLFPFPSPLETTEGRSVCSFLSERDTADRNFALAYYLQENKVSLALSFTAWSRVEWCRCSRQEPS